MARGRRAAAALVPRPPPRPLQRLRQLLVVVLLCLAAARTAHAVQPPTVYDVSVTLLEDTFADVQLNATDPQGLTLTYSLGAPDRGVTSLLNSAAGTFRYTPNANFAETDSLTYTVTNGGNTATGKVFFTVLAVNDPPTITYNTSVALYVVPSFSIPNMNADDQDSSTSPLECSIATSTLRLQLFSREPVETVTKTDYYMLVRGTNSAINLVLQKLVFFADTARLVNDTIRISLNDLGHTGLGGPQIINVSIPVRVGGTITAIDPADGPLEGNNTLTVRGVTLGSGSDIVNVTFNGRTARILSQTASEVIVSPAAATRPGLADTVTLSQTRGYVPLLRSYLVNEPGSLFSATPPLGSVSGGYTVTLRGELLGNGSDIQSASIRGAPATIVSQTNASLVVRAGLCPNCTTGPGDALIFSRSRGRTFRPAMFLYTQPDETRCKSFSLCTVCAINATCGLCPQASPIRCPSGHCVSYLANCTAPSVCPSDAPFSCFVPLGSSFGSSCYESFRSCPAAVCPGDQAQCADGSCRDGAELCDPLPACGADRMRCYNGECVDRSLACPNSTLYELSCAGRQLCQDGTCRTGPCPPYDGCPFARPFLCDDGTCAASLGACLCTSGEERCNTGLCAPDCAPSPVTRRTQKLRYRVAGPGEVSVRLQDAAGQSRLGRLLINFNGSVSFVNRTIAFNSTLPAPLTFAELTIDSPPTSEIERITSGYQRWIRFLSPVVRLTISTNLDAVRVPFAAALKLYLVLEAQAGSAAAVAADRVCFGEVSRYPPACLQTVPPVAPALAVDPTLSASDPSADATWARGDVSAPGMYAFFARTSVTVVEEASIPWLWIGVGVGAAALIVIVTVVICRSFKKKATIVESIGKYSHSVLEHEKEVPYVQTRLELERMARLQKRLARKKKKKAVSAAELSPNGVRPSEIAADSRKVSDSDLARAVSQRRLVPGGAASASSDSPLSASDASFLLRSDAASSAAAVSSSAALASRAQLRRADTAMMSGNGAFGVGSFLSGSSSAYGNRSGPGSPAMSFASGPAPAQPPSLAQARMERAIALSRTYGPGGHQRMEGHASPEQSAAAAVHVRSPAQIAVAPWPAAQSTAAAQAQALERERSERR